MPFLLTPAQAAFLPSDADVAFYREHGWWISPKCIDDALIDAAIASADRYYAGDYDRPLPGDARYFGWNPEHGNGLRKNDYSTLVQHGLEALRSFPLIGAMAARLTGTDEIRLWHDQLLYKPSDAVAGATVGKSNVGWHTDRGYWKVCTSDDMLTCWVPFHDCDEAMGTITMIDRSHRWGEPEGLNFFEPDLAKLEPAVDAARGKRPKVKVPMTLRKGQASFHHVKTIHGSGPNLSQAPRRSMAIHLQDGPNRWRRHEFPGGKIAEHCNDTLCRKIDGVPDYTDPAICPVLWREAEAAVGRPSRAGATF